jgi:hypothetical protein
MQLGKNATLFTHGRALLHYAIVKQYSFAMKFYFEFGNQYFCSILNLFLTFLIRLESSEAKN